MTPFFQLFGLQMVLLIDYRPQLLMWNSQAQSQQGIRPSQQPLLPPIVRLNTECRRLPVHTIFSWQGPPMQVQCPARMLKYSLVLRDPCSLEH